MSTVWPGKSRYCAQGFAQNNAGEFIRVVNRDTGELVALVPEGYEHWNVMSLLEGHPHKCYPDQPDDASTQFAQSAYEDVKENKT